MKGNSHVPQVHQNFIRICAVLSIQPQLRTFWFIKIAISNVSTGERFGIFVSCDLTWRYHTSYFVSKASVCYHILHSFSSKNVWILLQAYITYVRPVLEHNTVIWSPYLKKDIGTYRVESVQKCFTKVIYMHCNISFISYCDRLHKLGMKSLEYRRTKFDLILIL